MHSIRNIIITITLLCTVPLSLGAPTSTPAETPAPYNTTQSNPDSTEQNLDTTDTLDVLGNLLVTCGVTSRPGHDCAYNVCPPDEECKVSDAGNCVFTKPAKNRPVGCRYCKCYKTSS